MNSRGSPRRTFRKTTERIPIRNLVRISGRNSRRNSGDLPEETPGIPLGKLLAEIVEQFQEEILEEFSGELLEELSNELLEDFPEELLKRFIEEFLRETPRGIPRGTWETLVEFPEELPEPFSEETPCNRGSNLYIYELQEERPEELQFPEELLKRVSGGTTRKTPGETLRGFFEETLVIPGERRK